MIDARAWLKRKYPQIDGINADITIAIVELLQAILLEQNDLMEALGMRQSLAEDRKLAALETKVQKEDV